jgi:methylthioribose-1-phosphate isomerase
LALLDQRLLPRERSFVQCTTAAEVARAIRDMVVRGAPAIGVAAAYGMALEARRSGDLVAAREVLLASRPTAVNLRWAVEQLEAADPSTWEDAAIGLHRADIDANKAMGEHGAALLPSAAVVYTHCNAGALATGGWGTALGVVRSAWRSGRLKGVYAGETRPWLQGARLTAYELAEDGIPVTLVADVAAASVLTSGRVHAVIVGADRVAANGDTANKVGTLGVAILARHAGIPFYVAMPTSTLDLRCPDGRSIPIEERPADEVRGHAGVRWAADVPVWNPAFDVTPADLVTAWVTERGLWHPGVRQ